MVQGVAWSEAFAVGHPGLDREHRDMIASINAIVLYNGAYHSPQQLEDSFAGLKKLAVGHFEHENILLHKVLTVAQAGLDHSPLEARFDPGQLRSHIDAHISCGSDLDAIINQSLAQGGPMAEELRHWFFSHAVKADAHLKTLFQTLDRHYPRLLAQLA